MTWVQTSEISADRTQGANLRTSFENSRPSFGEILNPLDLSKALREQIWISLWDDVEFPTIEKGNVSVTFQLSEGREVQNHPSKFKPASCITRFCTREKK